MKKGTLIISGSISEVCFNEMKNNISNEYFNVLILNEKNMFESGVVLILFEFAQSLTFSATYDIMKHYVESIIESIKKDRNDRFEIKFKVEDKTYSATIKGESTEQQRNYVIETLAKKINVE